MKTVLEQMPLVANCRSSRLVSHLTCLLAGSISSDIPFLKSTCACISSFFRVNRNDRVGALPYVDVPVMQADIAEQLREHWAGVFIARRERAMPFIAVRKE